MEIYQNSTPENQVRIEKALGEKPPEPGSMDALIEKQQRADKRFFEKDPHAEEDRARRDRYLK